MLILDNRNALYLEYYHTRARDTFPQLCACVDTFKLAPQHALRLVVLAVSVLTMSVVTMPTSVGLSQSHGNDENKGRRRLVGKGRDRSSQLGVELFN